MFRFILSFNISVLVAILAGNYLPLISGSCDIISGDVISGDVISGDETPHDPPQMINRWCIYATNTEILNDKIKRNIKYNSTYKGFRHPI
jgi:hypothetical protein